LRFFRRIDGLLSLQGCNHLLARGISRVCASNRTHAVMNGRYVDNPQFEARAA
jgi:hypothetical protein